MKEAIATVDLTLWANLATGNGYASGSWPKFKIHSKESVSLWLFESETGRAPVGYSPALSLLVNVRHNVGARDASMRRLVKRREAAAGRKSGGKYPNSRRKGNDGRYQEWKLEKEDGVSFFFVSCGRLRGAVVLRGGGEGRWKKKRRLRYWSGKQLQQVS